MPSAILPSLSADEIDDLLYLARINAAQDLTASLETIAKFQQASPSDIMTATVDPESGNSLLHMASANGCMGMISYYICLRLSAILLTTLRTQRRPPVAPPPSSAFIFSYTTVEHKPLQLFRQHTTSLGCAQRPS